ncbi:MAG: F0F1 ATP synthase subunit B [Candidatus Kuenenbacteria bacterium]
MNILEILGKIGFDWRMGLANLVNFLIIFWLLKKYAFGPIAKKIKERDEKIQKGLEDSERAASEVMMAKENYEKKINEAKREANLIIAKAADQGKELVNKAAENAQDKAEKIISGAETVIQKEKETMIAEIKEETVEIAIQITEKIIKEKLDKASNETLIKKLIQS